MMKVFLSPSNQDGNRYAYGNVTEYDVCGDIAKLCKDALVSQVFPLCSSSLKLSNFKQFVCLCML